MTTLRPVGTLSEVLGQVRSRPAPHGLRIVGVDGPSGSGKSTLAARLAALTGAPVIPIDDFLSWQHLADWWPRFDAQVLDPLTAGRNACYQARDWSDWHGDTLGEWRTVPWSALVIVEGVTCTRAAAGDRLAYRVFVDAPAELRLARGLARDGAEHRDLWLDWMGREDAFFQADRTRDRADLRVDPDATPDSRSFVGDRHLVVEPDDAVGGAPHIAQVQRCRELSREERQPVEGGRGVASADQRREQHEVQFVHEPGPEQRTVEPPTALRHHAADPEQLPQQAESHPGRRRPRGTGRPPDAGRPGRRSASTVRPGPAGGCPRHRCGST